MTENLSIKQIADSSSTFSVNDFREMVNYVNTTNRGYVRFEKTANGIKLAKVSKHWYSEWAINHRTNIDAAHNKQMRQMFVNSMKMDYLSTEVKNHLKGVLYKTTNHDNGSKNEEALSRLEIKDALERYDTAYNKDRRNILDRIAKEYLDQFFENMPWEKDYAKTREAIDKFIRDNVKDAEKLLQDFDTMCLDPTRNDRGKSADEFRAFMEKFGGILDKAVTMQKIKQRLNGIIHTAIQTKTGTGAEIANGVNDNLSILSSDQVLSVKEHLLTAIKENNPDFQNTIKLSDDVGDTMNLLDIFVDKVLPNVLKKKVENCIEYTKLTDEQLKAFGEGTTKKQLIEQESQFDDLIEMAERFGEGVSKVLEQPPSDFVKNLQEDLTKMIDKAQGSLEKNEKTGLVNASDVANVYTTNWGILLRGLGVDAVEYSAFGGQDGLRLVGKIEKDLKHGAISFEKRVRIDNYTNKFRAEEVGELLVPDRKSHANKVFAKMEQRAKDINLALVIQDGNVEFKPNPDPNAKNKAIKVYSNYDVSSISQIVLDNLLALTQPYTTDDGVKHEALFNQKMCEDLGALALPAYLKKQINVAVQKKAKESIKEGCPLKLDAQQTFDALLTTFHSYHDALEDLAKMKNDFMEKFTSICDKNIVRGNLTEEQKTDILNTAYDELQKIALDDIKKEFFQHDSMNYEEGYDFVLKKFTDAMHAREKQATENILDKIVGHCDTLDPELVQQGRSGFNFNLKRDLMDQKGVADNYMAAYLAKHGNAIGKDNPFISQEDKLKKLKFTLANAYNSFLLNRLTIKRLFESKAVVITPQYIAGIKKDFSKFADKLMVKYVLFEVNLEKGFNSCLGGNWERIADSIDFVKEEMKLLSKEEKKQVIESLDNATRNALYKPCAELLDDFFRYPDDYDAASNEVEELVDKQVFRAHSNFNNAVAPIIQEQMQIVTKVLDNTNEKLANVQYDQYRDAFEKVLNKFDSAIKARKEDINTAKVSEQNELSKEQLKDITLEGLKEDVKSDVLEIMDDEMFEMLKQPVFTIGPNMVYTLVESCIEKVTAEAVAKSMFFGMGGTKECKERIEAAIRDTIKKELKKMSTFVGAYMAMAKEVFEGTHKKAGGDGFLALGKNGQSIIRRQLLAAVSQQDYPELDDAANELRAALQKQLDDLTKTKQREAERIEKAFISAFNRENEGINRGIELYFDENLKEEYGQQLYHYIQEKALPVFKETCLMEIGNNLKFFSSQEREYEKDDWSLIASNFIDNLRLNLQKMPLVDEKGVRKFLGELSEADGMAGLKELVQEVTIDSTLPPVEQEELKKLKEERATALNAIMENLKTWSRNQEEYVSVQKKLIDAYCEMYRAAVTANARNLTEFNHTDELKITVEIGQADKQNTMGKVNWDSAAFYADFKDDVLRGASSVMLTGNFNNSMVGPAAEAFRGWMKNEGLDVLPNKQGDTGLSIKDRLMEAFNKRVKTLQEKLITGTEVKEPILTIGFVDELMAIVDTAGIEAKLDNWLEANHKKYEEFFKNKYEGTSEFMNLEVAKKAHENDSENPLDYDVVRKAIKNNQDAVQSNLKKILEDVAKEYGSRLRYFHAFEELQEEMNTRVDNEIKKRMDLFEKQCKLRYDFELEMSQKVFISKAEDKFDMLMNDLFGVNHVFDNRNGTPDKIKSTLENSVQRLYDLANSDNGTSLWAQAEEKLRMRNKQHTRRELYDVIPEFRSVYMNFVEQGLTILRTHIENLTDTNDLERARSFMTQWFLEATGLVENLSKTGYDSLGFSDGDREKYNAYYSEKLGGKPGIPKKDMTTVTNFKTLVKIVRERAKRIQEKKEEREAAQRKK